MDNTLKEVLLDGAARQIRIRFPESDREEITSGIATGSAKLQCKLNSKEELNFGECNAAQFSVEIDDIDDITGEVIQVYALVEGYTPEVPIFYGKVYSAKRRPEIGSREIVAYDFLYDRAQEDVTSWYRTLFASVDNMTLLAFRTALFTYMGIQQETVTLMNDAVSVQKMILKDDAVLTFGDCVTAICQMNACFGHVSPSGGFEYVSLGENIYDYSANYQALKSSYEEYAVAPIDRIRLYDGMGNISVAAGSGTNTWNLANNFLLYGLAENTLVGIANRLMAHVGVIAYVPVRLDALISLPIEPGSKINVTTHTGDTFSTYALDLTYSGSQLVDQEISATGKELRDSSLSTDDTLILLDLRLQDTQSSVEEAHDEAAAAQTTANNAMTAANGKTKIFYQNDAPAAGMAVGDMWFDTDGGNAIYQYTANGWVLRQLGSGSLAANSVTAVEINVATLSAITANIGEVTAGVLKSTDYSYTSGTYTTAGMIIDLTNKVIRMPNTAILSDGSLYSKKGSIGGWTIMDTDIRYSSDNASGTEHDFVRLHSGGITAWHTIDTYAETTGFDAHTDGTFFINGGYLDVSSRTGNITEGTRILTQGIRLYSTGGGTDYSYNLTTGNGGFSSDANITAPTFIGSLTGHASLDLPLTGGTVSGSIAISATGKGFNLTDSSGTTYGGIYDNGNNLWIGATSSTNPHHRGANGNTYISAGYNTSSAAGNSTIYISVPSLSGITWSHTSYGVLHTGNYNSYALPLSGGTLSGNLTFSTTTDNGIIQGYNSTTKYTILRNHGNGNVSISACGAGMYVGYTNSTFVNFLNGKMSLNSQGSLTIVGQLSTGGKGTGTDGKAGTILSSTGNLYLQHTSGSNIYFFYGTSTSSTSRLYESASGTLTASANFNITGNLAVTTTSTSVDRTVTVANGNASGSVRAASGGAFGLYVTKTGGTARTAVYLTAMDSNGTYRTNWNPSDRRVKNIIGDMPDSEAETLLRRLKIYNFRYKTDATKTVQNGMIAQQVRDVLSECGYGYRLYLDIRSADGEDFLYNLNTPEQDVQYGIDYARMTPILWKGWQLHDGKILNHEDRIATLERENNRLKKEIELLKGDAA